MSEMRAFSLLVVVVGLRRWRDKESVCVHICEHLGLTGPGSSMSLSYVGEPSLLLSVNAKPS